MVLNRGTTALTVAVPFEDIGDSLHTTYAVRDLWARANVSVIAHETELQLDVPAHGVRLPLTVAARAVVEGWRPGRGRQKCSRGRVQRCHGKS